jgi:citrate synthase
VVMQGFLEELSRRKEDYRYLEILKELERDFRSRMEEKGKPLYPNVDFFSGAVYALLGIPTILFTPLFAMARVAGWLAHILEQRRDNRLYRPASLYTGSGERHYVPIGER